MSPLLGKRKNLGQPAWYGRSKTQPKALGDGWRFSLKGSPRHYDDVKRIIESDPGATVYFGEALTYERGAGVALWRVEAKGFDWLPRLYDWWAEQERIEPIQFTFHLYLPRDLKYSVMDLRDHTPDEVAAFIQANAPRSQQDAEAAARRF
ncbi:MAG TPA: hypothetical protein VH482_17250 [Thermomicrobiales bacterium]